MNQSWTIPTSLAAVLWSGATMAMVTNDITCPSLQNLKSTEHFGNSAKLGIH